MRWAEKNCQLCLRDERELGGLDSEPKSGNGDVPSKLQEERFWLGIRKKS